MFNYYGGKEKIGGRYPSPSCSTLIEPFCGAAKYALRYWWLDVTIADKWEVIYRIWKYLQNATPKMIQRLPVLKKGQKISDCKQLCQDERWILGFAASQGSGVPRNTITSWCDDGKKKNQILTLKEKILYFLPRIQHWKILHCDYREIPNQQATWFIDPPYNGPNQQHYKIGEGQINYSKLGEWSKDRQGEVIVCESAGADWLPFKNLGGLSAGAKFQTQEVFYYQNNLSWNDRVWERMKANKLKRERYYA